MANACRTCQKTRPPLRPNPNSRRRPWHGSFFFIFTALCSAGKLAVGNGEWFAALVNDVDGHDTGNDLVHTLYSEPLYPENDHVVST